MSALPETFIGKAKPASGVLFKLLEVPSTVKFATLQINAVNDAGTVATVAVALSASITDGAVEQDAWIETADEVPSKGRWTDFGLIVAGGTNVWVRSNNASTIWRATALAHLLPVA